MRRRVVDELEERRVVRRLRELAEAVEPLSDEELDVILARAAAGSARRPRSLRLHAPRHLPSVAAAAAVLAIAVGIGRAPWSSDDPHVGGTASEQLLAFPEGSALELLLSRADAERPA